MKKKALQAKNPFCVLVILMIAIFIMAGCQEKPEPIDTSYSPPRFTITLETSEEQEIKISLGLRNSNIDAFPGDESFNAVMSLWDESGVFRSKMTNKEAPIIEPDESIDLASFQGELLPGVYFMNWGAAEYGSEWCVFTVVSKEEGISLGKQQFFSMKPADYDVSDAKPGSIESFSTAEDGAHIFEGETPIPDQGRLFVLVFDENGLIQGMPTGQFASITDGHWRIEILPGTLALDPDTAYSVLLFSDDLGISTSEPFVINLSPPV